MEVGADDPVFRRVMSGGHADLLSVERAVDERTGKEKGSISVETTRKIAPFLRLSAAEGGWRIVIIDDADTMNRAAQNSILKILEEPPAHVMMILVTHRPGALIPTIRSRAQILPFSPLSDDNLQMLLRKQQPGLSDADLRHLFDLSEGSAGQAMHYLEQGGLDLFDRTAELLEDVGAWNWAQIHGLADELSRLGQDNAYLGFQDILQWMMQSTLKSKARATGEPHWAKTRFRAFLQNSSLVELSKTCENLSEHFIQVDRANLDKRQAVMGAFAMIG